MKYSKYKNLYVAEVTKSPTSGLIAKLFVLYDCFVKNQRIRSNRKC